jgi:hypothetical protein
VSDSAERPESDTTEPRDEAWTRRLFLELLRLRAEDFILTVMTCMEGADPPACDEYSRRFRVKRDATTGGERDGWNELWRFCALFPTVDRSSRDPLPGLELLQSIPNDHLLIWVEIAEAIGDIDLIARFAISAGFAEYAMTVVHMHVTLLSRTSSRLHDSGLRSINSSAMLGCYVHSHSPAHCQTQRFGKRRLRLHVR